jgi:hypothetical protein
MKRHILISSIALATALAGAQAQQTTPPTTDPSQAQQATPPTTEPSTSHPEGVRTRPGETPTQGAPRQEQDPRPSTSQTEGTAADRTAPGRTPTTQGEATTGNDQGSDIVGAAVVSTANAQLGEVVDVVFDAAKQPAFVVIESKGKTVAMPYATADSMKRADKIVVDQVRLQAAPKIEEGAWRDQSNTGWRQDSTRYWQRGS